MNHRLSLLAVPALSAALLLGACGGAPAASPAATPTPTPSPSPSASPLPSQSAPAEETAGILSSFSTVDLDGNEVDESLLEDYTLTMVNVWATFCSPCLGEMPDLGELSEEYADQGVRIVGLVTDVLNSDGTYSEEQLDTAREIVSATGADYLHILPSEDLYGLLAQMPYVPTTFFVDSQGRQVSTGYQGAKDKEGWIAAIDQALAEVEQ